jgi:SAM-dependent methyltransferase
MADPQTYDAARWRAFEHDGWQVAARKYDDWIGTVTTQAVTPMLDAVGAAPGVRLLDVATGPGYVAAQAAERGAEVVGLDFAAEMVAEASTRYPDLTFREGDAEALPFPDASFDVVTCNFGLLHFSHPERAIAEVGRVLRPGGRYAFTVWDEMQERDSRQIVRRAVAQHGDAAASAALPDGPSQELFLDPSWRQENLDAGGLVPTAEIKLPIVQATPDPDTYIDVMLVGTGPRNGAVLRLQPPEALAAIRAAVRDALSAFVRDGIAELPMAAVLVVAQKP